jgi:hypothetical protein
MQQSMQFLLPQHISGTNMHIIRSTISEYLPLLGGRTWKAAWVVLHWAAWSEHCFEDVARLGAQWLRHCATNRKVVGSIPDGVTGFFPLT